MTPQNLANGIVRAVLILAGIVLFFWFLYAIRSVIAYLTIAAVIALLGKPIVRLLQRIRIPNTIAVLVAMSLLFGLFAGILALFIPVVSEQSKNLSLLDIDALKNNINLLKIQPCRKKDLRIVIPRGELFSNTFSAFPLLLEFNSRNLFKGRWSKGSLLRIAILVFLQIVQNLGFAQVRIPLEKRVRHFL